MKGSVAEGEKESVVEGEGLWFRHCWARSSQGHPKAGQGGVPRLRFPSDLGVHPHITGALLKMGDSTPTQERINN